MGRLLFGLFLLWSTGVSTDACSCIKLTARCDNGWNSGEAIFFGRVSAVLGGEMEPIGNGFYRLTDHEVHFAEVEFFHGGSKAAHEAVVFTGSGGGDCGYPFVAGTSYLVYAFNNNGRLMTGICGETAPEAMVSGALRELRALRDGGHVDNLFGTVGIAPIGSWEGLVQSRPLANVPVYAIRRGGKRFAAKTDEHGVYAFPFLPPGTYRIKEDLPAGVVLPRHRNDYWLRHAEIKKETTGSGCRVDVFPRATGNEH